MCTNGFSKRAGGGAKPGSTAAIDHSVCKHKVSAETDPAVQTEPRLKFRSSAFHFYSIWKKYVHEVKFKYLISKQVESIDGLQSSFSETHGAGMRRNTKY